MGEPSGNDGNAMHGEVDAAALLAQANEPVLDSRPGPTQHCLVRGCPTLLETQRPYYRRFRMCEVRLVDTLAQKAARPQRCPLLLLCCLRRA